MNEFYSPEARTGMPRVLRVQLPICDRVVATEIASEVSLPDYQPEIKRLLRVSTTVQPPARYVGGGSMEFSGTVDYCIYYTGNDGQMYCFPTAEEYSFRVPLEAGADFDLGDALVCTAMSEPENVTSRVTGPRRMSIKCRLRSRVMAYGSCIMEEKGGLPGGEERLLREVESAVASYSISEPFVVQDEIIPERDEGEMRIISGDAQLLIHDGQCAAGRVSFRGEMVLKLLLQKEEEGSEPIALTRKLPLEQSVVMEQATPDGAVALSASCSELRLSMEDGRILCEAEMVLEARMRRRQAVSYTADLYLTERESTCGMRQYVLPVTPVCLNGNMTQSETMTMSDAGITAPSRVIDVQGNARAERLEIERGKYVLSGKCRYTMVLMSDGELSSKEIELPFRYTAEGSAPADQAFRWEGQVVPVNVRARMDAERLSLDAELGIWLCVNGEQAVDMVTDLVAGEAIRRPAGQLTLCYPAKDDTLWSVGKRYRTSLAKLEAANPDAIKADLRADDAGSIVGTVLIV